MLAHFSELTVFDLREAVRGDAHSCTACVYYMCTACHSHLLPACTACLPGLQEAVRGDAQSVLDAMDAFSLYYP